MAGPRKSKPARTASSATASTPNKPKPLAVSPPLRSNPKRYASTPEPPREPTPYRASHRHNSVVKIISGGQTGVDRAALDAAMELGLAHGGWCPKGRRAEDGRIPEQYQLLELKGAEYMARTLQNVVDSDGTLLLLLGELEGGSLLTWRLCKLNRKPVWIHRLQPPSPDTQVRQWLATHRIHTLNVAGPRASKSPNAYPSAYAYLLRLFGHAPQT